MSEPTEGRLKLQPVDIAEATALFRAHGVLTDPDSVSKLATAIFWTRFDFAKAMRRCAQGDWGTDRTVEKFPEFALQAPEVPPKSAPIFTMTALLSGWAQDHGYDLDAKPIHRSAYARVKPPVAPTGTLCGSATGSRAVTPRPGLGLT